MGLCDSYCPVFFSKGTSPGWMLNNDVVPQFLGHFHKHVGGVFRHLWWGQDGAPAHHPCAVTQRIRELFGNRIVALHHAMEWALCPPDFTHCGELVIFKGTSTPDLSTKSLCWSTIRHSSQGRCEAWDGVVHWQKRRTRGRYRSINTAWQWIPKAIVHL